MGGRLISGEDVVTKGDFTPNVNIQSMPETFFFFFPRKELHMKIEKYGEFGSSLLCCFKQHSVARL